MNWTLLGYGSLSWDLIREKLAGATCTWADYRGFHRDPCPDKAPPYSHLWAWTADQRTMFRVRILGNEGILGVLTQDHTAQAPGLTPRTVAVRRMSGIPWGNDEQQIGSQPNEIFSGEFELFEVLQPMPITFVSSRPASSGAVGD